MTGSTSAAWLKRRRGWRKTWQQLQQQVASAPRPSHVSVAFRHLSCPHTLLHPNCASQHMRPSASTAHRRACSQLLSLSVSVAVPAARTPAPNMTRPLSPGGTSLCAQLVERMASPELTDGLKDMHNQMLIKQLTAAEKKVKELEGENMRLKEQVCRTGDEHARGGSCKCRAQPACCQTVSSQAAVLLHAAASQTASCRSQKAELSTAEPSV